MAETIGPKSAARPVAPPSAWEQYVTGVLGALRLNSLKSKITALALIATLVPSLTMGWLFYVHNRRLLEENISQELQNMTAQASREIDLRLREGLYDIRVFSTSAVVTETVERLLGAPPADGSADRKRLENYLRSVRAKFADYEELLVVDSSGKILATSAGKAGPTGLPDGWVRLAQADKPVLGDAYRDDALDKAVVVMAEPIRSLHDRFMGVLAAKLDLEALGRILETYSARATSEVRLVDRQGRTLAGPSQEASARLQVDLAPAITERLFAGEGTSVHYTSRSRAVVGSVKRLQQLEAGVLAQLDRERAFAQVIRLRNVTIGLVLGLMVVIGLAAYLLGLTVVRPLDRLAKGSAHVAAGDLRIALPVLGRGEVAYLTDAFNDMVRRLFHARRELDGTHETLRETNAELQALATTDSLTGLHNRHSLVQTLSAEIERARRGGRPLGLLMIDVDHFKKYNDSHGHLAGDEILRRAAGLLKSEIRSCDHAARYGGDEFVVLLPDADSVSTMQVAERIRSRAEVAMRAGGDGATPITMSLGLAVFPEHASAPEALLREADMALYEAKRAGRNGVGAAVCGKPRASS